ncbi:flavin-dependent dehydrogenase [Melghirimyces profundicolus]|uniref:Flavin-dependent dehydrogenase n=1 Tax=Melghirimyces profundicolus TaxID=1242148 RepID=A0A2T6B151_9BACL|nr:styrene monooxygenase/indole monooxygenase family protein [Melghirimyces profundicolus]PTX49808.1 flavin-dependent dehydrogenase [Melghirimyces profundicolus]
MKRRVGIMGGGSAGLQLAYSLKDEFEVTVFHHRSADQVRQGRILSTQVHFGGTLERECRFHMPEWDSAPPIHHIHLTIGDQKLFVGKLVRMASSVDQRWAYARGMMDLAEKGVDFRLKRVYRDELESLAGEFDLLVDATGKSGPLAPFPVLEEWTPFQRPQRKCIVGYFKGVKLNEPPGVGVTVLPGVGEMFEIPALTERGPVDILFIEAVPDGVLDAFKGVKTTEAFTERMENVTRRFFPEIHGRIAPGEFGLVDENAYLQVALTPAIRRPYLSVNGTPVIGCGDSVFLNDPITGQGSNVSSYCAEQLYETLITYQVAEWDEQVGQTYWERSQPFVRAVTEWTLP